MRHFLFFFFAAITIALLLVAAGVLKNTWAGDPDGPRWVYLVFGLLLVGFALLPLLGLRALLRTRRRHP